ncbi:MAG: alpha/beta hydrolase fold domain-containing protein [Candidatus Bipolaricaulota bacterium]|nr:alpha/beta hydrolase fold domain-containing protein [Candidatus Bipolaricaulota bacterium]MDW8141228.1 alpha/beta hydrolase fold domain-containing protein [Candidatus Bipolaricaulota bacterium]
MNRFLQLVSLGVLIALGGTLGASGQRTTDAGYITFAINVHNFRHLTESADTLLRLIAIFEKYKVKGDFYLTGPMADLYAQQRPDLIQRLRESGMTISYHQRPPHPIYAGFDRRFRTMSDDAAKSLLRDYETYKLDLTTGELQRNQPGGYTYVTSLMGRKPVVPTAPSNDPRVRRIAWQLYRELDAQMTITYHESGTKMEKPFEWVEGLARSVGEQFQPPRPSEFDVTYCVMDGVELKMDIYRPRESTAPTPALLYVHGGGWTSGDKRSGEGVRDTPELLARGYLVAAVNYRLAPRYKFPAMIQDVKCAVRFLRANAQRYNINPDKIGAWGGSAGGHLVALLGTADETAGWEVGQYLDQSSRVQAVVDMYGPTDLTVLFEGANPRLMEQVFGTSDRNSETLKRASPINWVSPEDPPFLILHGERDILVPVSQSQIFYEKLRAANVPVTLVIVKNAGHGFAPMGGPISPTRQELTKMMGDFFDQYLKK